MAISYCVKCIPVSEGVPRPVSESGARHHLLLATLQCPGLAHPASSEAGAPACELDAVCLCWTLTSDFWEKLTNSAKCSLLLGRQCRSCCAGCRGGVQHRGHGGEQSAWDWVAGAGLPAGAQLQGWWQRFPLWSYSLVQGMPLGRETWVYFSNLFNNSTSSPIFLW